MNNAQNLLIYIVVVLIGTVFIAGCSSSGNIPAADTSNGDVVQQASNAAAGNSADNGANVGNTQGSAVVARGQFNGNRSPGRYGGMNLTDEQKVQMMQQRIRAETDACSGKSENDVCSVSMQGQNGAGIERNGTCTLQNSTLLCRTNFGGGRGPSGIVPPNIPQ